MSKPLKTPAWLALVLLLSACGPTVDLSIRVRQEPADVTYGAPTPAAVAPLGPRPFQPATGTNAPGFIAPPVFTGELPPLPSAPVPGTEPTRPAAPSLPPLPCPTAPPDAVPSEAAPTTVRGAPVAGTYSYRRTGTLKSADATELGQAAPVKLPTELTRTVQNIQTVPGAEGGDQTTYDVVSEEGGVRSTTSWLIVSPVTGDADTGSAGRSGPGMFIRRIETTVRDKDGVLVSDVFQPTPPVKVLDLPFVPQTFDTTPVANRGVDPITGANMDVFPATEGQVTVDVCGTLFRAWRVRLGQEAPSTTGPNRVVNEYVNPLGHRWKFIGTLDVLPQLGGIVVQDSFHFFEGLDDRGKTFDLRTTAVLGRTTPRTAP